MFEICHYENCLPFSPVQIRMDSQLASKLLDKDQLRKGHVGSTFLPGIAVT